MREQTTCEENVIPLGELRQQLEYARVIGTHLGKLYQSRTPKLDILMNEYRTARLHISMLQDFLFQAQLWCDTLMSEGNINDYKEEE